MNEDIKNTLKLVMRVYPQGVTVVTTELDGPKGLTVSSFTSASLDPPLILFLISRGSKMHEVLRKAGSYAVNFLAEDQKSVSDRFAGRTDVKDRFEGIKFTRGVTGSPIISGARAVLECKAWRVYEVGDHSIFVGEVVSAKIMNSKPPLIYYSQQYTTTGLVEYPAPRSDFVW